MNVFLRLNINVLNYFLIYVRMLRTPNFSWVMWWSYDGSRQTRCFKSCVLSFTWEKQRVFPTIRSGVDV